MVMASCKNPSSSSPLLREKHQSRGSYLYTSCPVFPLYSRLPLTGLEDCSGQYPRDLSIGHYQWMNVNSVIPPEVTLLTIETASWRGYAELGAWLRQRMAG